MGNKFPTYGYKFLTKGTEIDIIKLVAAIQHEEVEVTHQEILLAINEALDTDSELYLRLLLSILIKWPYILNKLCAPPYNGVERIAQLVMSDKLNIQVMISDVLAILPKENFPPEIETIIWTAIATDRIPFMVKLKLLEIINERSLPVSFTHVFPLVLSFNGDNNQQNLATTPPGVSRMPFFNDIFYQLLSKSYLNHDKEISQLIDHHTIEIKILGLRLLKNWEDKPSTFNMERLTAFLSSSDWELRYYSAELVAQWLSAEEFEQYKATFLGDPLPQIKAIAWKKLTSINLKSNLQNTGYSWEFLPSLMATFRETTDPLLIFPILKMLLGTNHEKLLLSMLLPLLETTIVLIKEATINLCNMLVKDSTSKEFRQSLTEKIVKIAEIDADAKVRLACIHFMAENDYTPMIPDYLLKWMINSLMDLPESSQLLIRILQTRKTTDIDLVGRLVERYHSTLDQDVQQNVVKILTMCSNDSLKTYIKDLIPSLFTNLASFTIEYQYKKVIALFISHLNYHFTTGSNEEIIYEILMTKLRNSYPTENQRAILLDWLNHYLVKTVKTSDPENVEKLLSYFSHIFLAFPDIISAFLDHKKATDDTRSVIFDIVLNVMPELKLHNNFQQIRNSLENSVNFIIFTAGTDDLLKKANAFKKSLS